MGLFVIPWLKNIDSKYLSFNVKTETIQFPKCQCQDQDYYYKDKTKIEFICILLKTKVENVDILVDKENFSFHGVLGCVIPPFL